jgi:membrane-associated phospholipid phosphatase
MAAVTASEFALRVGVLLLAVAMFAASMVRARALRVPPAEERFFRLFNDGPDAVYLPVWAVMQAGSLAAVFVVTAVLKQTDERPRTIVTFVAGFLVWAGVKRAKRFVGRGRPGAHLDDVHVRGQPQVGLGYPSGHAAVSVTLALLATEGAGVGLQIAAIGVALFTGGARMYVGAHLPLDVAGGFAVGIVVAQIGSVVVDAVG